MVLTNDNRNISARRIGWLFAVVISLAFFSKTSFAWKWGIQTVQIDTIHQLFLDDYVIENLDNVDRKIQSVEKFPGNPIFWPSKLWDRSVPTPISIFYDEEMRKYRMWYTDANAYSDNALCYAESSDGIHWEKPPLGIVKIDRHDTNILMLNDIADDHPAKYWQYYEEAFGVYKDMSEKDPKRRYKLNFLSINHQYEGPDQSVSHHRQKRGIGLAVSADGYRWELVDPFVSCAVIDGHNYWMKDPKSGNIVYYGRVMRERSGGNKVNELIRPAKEAITDPWVEKYYYGRSVCRIETEDFLNWDYTKSGTAPVVLWPDAQDPMGSEIYGMMVFPYENLYIGLVQMLHKATKESVYMDIHLAISRDTKKFERVGDRSPFISPDGLGTWSPYRVKPVNAVPIIRDNKVMIYYSSRQYRHDPYSGDDHNLREILQGYIPGGGMGIAMVCLDRFVAMEGNFAGGTIETKPLTIIGTSLHINAISDYGKIIVTVKDLSGETLAVSELIRADGLDIEVPWKFGSMNDLPQKVRLEFELYNAKLFSFWSK